MHQIGCNPSDEDVQVRFFYHEYLMEIFFSLVGDSVLTFTAIQINLLCSWFHPLFLFLFFFFFFFNSNNAGGVVLAAFMAKYTFLKENLNSKGADPYL